MKKKTDERTRRTLTLTFGPLAWEQLRLLAEECSRPEVGVVLSRLDICGSLATTGMVRVSRDVGLAVPEGLVTHFD
jgi:hypothetical protein